MENEVISDLQQHFSESEFNPSTLKVEIIVDDETDDGMLTTSVETLPEINNVSHLGKYFILFLFIGALVSTFCCLIIIALCYLFKKRKRKKQKISTHFVKDADGETELFRTKHGIDSFKLPLLHSSNVEIPVLNIIDEKNGAYVQIEDGDLPMINALHEVDVDEDIGVVVYNANGVTAGFISDGSMTESSIFADYDTNAATTSSRPKYTVSSTGEGSF